MNDCPALPPLVFHYAGVIAVDGVVFFVKLQIEPDILPSSV
jgi:hypothetical protein